MPENLRSFIPLSTSLHKCNVSRLVILNSARDLSFLEPYINHSDVIVCSSLSILREMHKKDYLNSYLLCTVAPYTSVREDVLKKIKYINLIFEALSSSGFYKADLLGWPLHVEGNDLPQYLQDRLLLVSNIKILLENIYLRELLMTNSVHPHIISSIDNLCQKNNIKLNLISCKVYGEIRSKERIRLYSRAIAGLALFLIRFFAIYATSFGLRKVIKAKVICKHVIIQLCSLSPKFLDQYSALITSLSHKGQPVTFITWGCKTDRANRLCNNALFLPIEHYLNLCDLFECCFLSFKLLVHLLITQKKIRESSSLCEYENVFESVFVRTLRKYFELILLHRGLVNFSTAVSNCYVKVWTRLLPEGIIAYQALSQYGKCNQFFDLPCTTLDDGSIQIQSLHPVDFIFVDSQSQAQLFLASQNSDVICPKTDISSHSYGTSVNIPLTSNIKNNEMNVLEILVDISYVSSGYYSESELVLLINIVNKFAANHPTINILVKPHPNATNQYIRTVLFLIASLPNIHIISKDTPAIELLKRSSILVTKYSFMASQAKYYDCKCVCFLPNKDMIFKIYPEVAEYAFSSDELYSCLNIMVSRETHHKSLAACFDTIFKPLTQSNLSIATDLLATTLVSRLSTLSK